MEPKSVSESVLNRLKEIPHKRVAFVVGVASILLIAGLSTVDLSVADDNDGRKKIMATGEVSTQIISPDISLQRTPDPVAGPIQLRTRHFLSTYAGTLQGTAYQLNTVWTDLSAPAPRLFENSGTGTFVGTLAGSAEGSFTYVGHTRGFVHADGSQTFEATLTVVEGSGLGGLASICGGGKIVGSGPPFVSTYDFTFRFGKDCKAND